MTQTVGSGASSASLWIDTKVSGSVGTLEGGNAIQVDLDRLERWGHVNITRFNEAKSKALHLGRGNPWYEYRLGAKEIGNSGAEKDLGILLDKRLDMNEQLVLKAQKVTCILGCIPSSVASRARGGFCPSTLLL